MERRAWRHVPGWASAAPAADPKIALVDLRKVFDGYYKTKDADAKINCAYGYNITA